MVLIHPRHGEDELFKGVFFQFSILLEPHVPASPSMLEHDKQCICTSTGEQRQDLGLDTYIHECAMILSSGKMAQLAAVSVSLGSVTPAN